MRQPPALAAAPLPGPTAHLPPCGRRTWKCISDPRSINPFPGSFLNYTNTLRFTPMTDGKQSIVQWDGAAPLARLAAPCSLLTLPS